MASLSELIAESSERFEKVIGLPVSPPEDINRDAKGLLSEDDKTLLRLGERHILPKLDSAQMGVDFNSFLAESLLRDGSLLLDRCLQQRREYHDLLAKYFDACVQIDELRRLNVITEQEEALYQLPVQASDLETLAHESEQRGAAEAEKNAKDALDLNGANLMKIVLAVRSAAWAQARTNPYADYGAKHFGNAGYPDHDFAQIQVDGAGEPIEHNLRVEQRGLTGQYRMCGGQSDASRERASASRLLHDYKRRMAELQNARNDVSRLVATRRAYALTSEGGALNYKEQMKPIKDRFEADLTAAWLRLSRSAEGMKNLYGYSLPFPSVADDGSVSFDELVTWCQKTATWLSAFQDRQQVMTRSFSLRALLKEDSKFDEGKDKSRWTFSLDQSHFSGCRLLRLRGISLQVRSTGESGSWNFSISPPQRSKIVQETGQEKELDQTHAGAVFLGRVNERTYTVAPEGSSPARLFNVSPLGEWTLEVLGAATSGLPVASLADIDLHLAVAIL